MGTLAGMVGEKPKCSCCGEREAVIWTRGYAENHAGIFLCEFCALQLARKVLEDICEVEGDRHG